MATKTFTAIIHKEEDIYVAECPEVSTVSQGESVEEAITNLKEATELCVEEFPLPENSLPITTSFEANYA
jgi:predicted RNase H-like HicB family nuclease